MKLYYNKISSISLLRHFLFRHSFKRTIKDIIKFILSEKILCKTNSNFVCFTHKRKSEDRVYGIVEGSTDFLFFKLSFNEFITLFKKDENSLASHFLSVGQKLIPAYYYHDILNRKEFEGLGYGIKDAVYHGDLSKGNVLKYNEEIILIDNELQRFNSELYQNVDYLINCFYGNNYVGNKYYDLNWWLSVVQIFNPTTKEELISVFDIRLLNGCDIASKILDNEKSTK